MKTFTYVYLLQSKADSRWFYTGCTLDLRDRLARHNSGEVPNRWKPWRVKTYLAFSDRALAKALRHEDVMPAARERILDYCRHALSESAYPASRFYSDLAAAPSVGKPTAPRCSQP